jgi:hypothetical protein
LGILFLDRVPGVDHHLLRPRAENQPAFWSETLLLILAASEGNGEPCISAAEYSLLMIVTGMSPIRLRPAQASFST